MAQTATIDVVGVEMEWEEFVRLPDDERAEYVDGRVFMTPPPTYGHQKICMLLRDVLTSQLQPPAIVAVGVGWQLPGPVRRLRIPDVMVLDSEPADGVVTSVPRIVVEVLSTNRSDDLVRKSTEYLDAGAGQYWIIDPRDRALDVFSRVPDGWDQVARLTDDAPDAVVTVPGSGRVSLSLFAILDGSATGL